MGWIPKTTPEPAFTTWGGATALAGVLRSRGKNSSRFDIDRAADMIEELAQRALLPVRIVSHPTGSEVADGWISGFIHGVGREPWDDMHDYAAVCAVEYEAARRATRVPGAETDPNKWNMGEVR